MAKPDCDDGWHKIAYELEAALDFADFSKPARTVLRFGFAQIYGKGARPSAMVLPQSALAARVGRPRQWIYRGIRELVESRVLEKDGDGDRYLFVKNYEAWRRDGRARLTPAEVADCKLAPDYAREFEIRAGRHGSVINRDDTRRSHDDSSVVNPDDTPRSDDDTSVINPDDADAPGGPPVINPDDTVSVVDESVINPDDTPRSDEDTSVINPDDAGGSVSSIQMTPCHQSRLQTVISIDDKTAPPYVPPSRKESIRIRENTPPIDCLDGRTRAGSAPGGGPDRGKEAVPATATQGYSAEEKRLRKFILAQTTREVTPRGNDDYAEFAVQQYRLWTGQGYPVAVVKDAIKAGLKAVGVENSLSWSRWVTSYLGRWAEKTRSLPAAPARPRPAVEYFVADPEDQFTRPGPRSKP